MVAVLDHSPGVNPQGIFFPHEVNNSREAIIANVRENTLRGLPELGQCEWTDKPLMIVCGGPSLSDNLELIRALRDECSVMAVNGAYKFLRSQGIESDYFVLIDSREGNLTHVEAPSKKTHHLLASQVHPVVFDALEDHKVSIFHLGTEATIEALGSPDGQDYLTAPIGMASVHAIYLGAGLGHKNLMLFGYDFSQSDQPYAYEQLMNLSDETIEIPVDGRTFKTTISLARTADQFALAVAPVIRGCGLNIQMYSDGLLPALLRSASKPATEESERQKYVEIWQNPDYRKVSPGLESVQQAVDLLNVSRGTSIADFGCGTGRCVKWFIDNDLNGIGIDITHTALEEDVPFIESALWDADKLPKVDYGFTTDVMEHIPADRVEDVMKAIADSVSRGCYFNIDTIPDSFGITIGKRLHLTVQPAEWWEEKLKAVWANVYCVERGERQAIFVCSH